MGPSCSERRRDDGLPVETPRPDATPSKTPAPRLPASRRISGDLGWRLDDESRGGGEPIGLLRIASVIPFVGLGAVAVIALVGWALFFVLGFGAQPSLWSWASGEAGDGALRQIGLVLLLGLACLGGLVLAMWATLYGFGQDAARWFWGLWEVLGILALGGLVAVEALPRARHAAGLGVTDVAFVGVILVASIVLFRLREVRASTRVRDVGQHAG